MVRGIAIRLEQHLIIDLLVVEGDRATKRVVYDRRATLLHLEPHHRRLALPGSNVAWGKMAAQPIIAQHLFISALLLAHDLQTLGSAPTAIRGTSIDQLLGITLVQIETL